MKKNAVMMMLMGVVVGTMLYTRPVCAASASDAMEVAGTAAAATGVAVEAARIGYEGSVISRMIGRAGATAPNGAKGIAFEVLYQDAKNLKESIVSGVKTQFTKSSTAKTVDLVSMSKDGKVVGRYQLKDTPNSISDTIKKVKTGQYNSAQLVCTSETAEAFNAEAAKKGISKVVVDSGISTETTTRIAQKALGNLPSASDLASTAGKAAKAGGVVSGGVALVESTIRGDDFGETVGNVSVKTAEGAASAAVAGTAGEVIAVGVGAAGLTGASAVVVPAAATIAIGGGVMYGLDKANEAFGLEDKIAGVANNTKDIVVEKATAVYERVTTKDAEADEQVAAATE